MRIPRKAVRVLGPVLPQSAIQGDWVLTLSGERLLRRIMFVCFGIVGIALAVVSILALPGNWADVMGGALLAWSVNSFFWSFSSFKTLHQASYDQLEHQSELALLHHRLNHIAAKLEAPVIDLDFELPSAIATHQTRRAHLFGMEDFTPPQGATELGHKVWAVPPTSSSGTTIDTDPFGDGKDL